MDSYLDGNNYEGHEYNRQREYEKGGLIPITANIINMSQITPEETVEYLGIQLSDINIVGFVVDFKELENKVKILLYDYTGTVEISFFNKMDYQDNLELNKFKYSMKKIPIHIYGTVKVYKNEKCLQGAKLLEATSSSVLYHRADVIYSWFYLTGKLQELKENSRVNQNNNQKLLVNQNGDNNNDKNGKKLDESEAERMLDVFVKSSGKTEIEENKLLDLFKKFGGKKKDIPYFLNNSTNKNWGIHILEIFFVTFDQKSKKKLCN